LISQIPHNRKHDYQCGNRYHCPGVEEKAAEFYDGRMAFIGKVFEGD
jgi:hypothetical protein